MQVWSRILEAIDRHGSVVMVTVAATKGSTPREAGARMILHPDGAFTGTIGGGTLEWRAIAVAQAMLAQTREGKAHLRPFILGPDMGQCCGGQVELLFEVIPNEGRGSVAEFAQLEATGPFATSGSITEMGVERTVVDVHEVRPGAVVLDGTRIVESFGDDRRPVLLFGAGHVGRAIVLALAPLPFAVTWVDPRPDAFPAYVPANVTLSRPADPLTPFDSASSGSFVLIMSHSHQLDLALTGAALSDDRFPYVGLIGSKSKRMRFERRLVEAGIDRGRVAALICPIGVEGIESKAPAAIAAATAAELIIRDEALRAGRAMPVEILPLRRSGRA
jgi:xanthine dehydrogenase accessory factor